MAEAHSPVLIQEGREARLEVLARFEDFGFLRLFKDGSGDRGKK